MADYSMVGSFGSDAVQSLNGDIINKLREAEEESVLDPIDQSLEDWETELEVITNIESKINELKAAMSPFDLYSSTANAFEQVTASTTGDSAIFDALDVGGLNEGIVTVNITQLAQKDVFQTNTFADETAVISTNVGDKISIQVGTAAAIDFSVENKTYEELADEINSTTGLNASVEQVGDSSYRIVIKSEDSGTENALTITQTGIDLGLNDAANHTLTAQNLQATVDGVAYDVSSGTITVDNNLKITATKLGESTISIQKDDSSVLAYMQEVVTAYNEVVTAVNDELYSDESTIEDRSGLRDILNTMKNLFFAEYGADTPTFGTEVDEYGDTVYAHSNVTNNDKSIFNYGFSFDTDGYLVLDEGEFSSALTENMDDIKALFLGSAENEGLGTQLKSMIDELNSSDGLITLYGDNMADRKTTLEEEREKAVATLDAKYDLMASQFAAYGALIGQMEASFGGLKMIIQQSTSSN